MAFASELLGIDMHPGQERMFNAYLMRSKPRWWVALYLTIAVSAGNRAGKTLAVAIIIIHACLYKMGLKPPENDREAASWMRHPYLWFHFAIAQEIADLVFNEIRMILNGTHPAQKGRGCPLTDAVPDIVQTDVKYNGDYRWIVFSQGVGGAEVHFRTTGERAIGSLGRDMNGISFDECGFEPKLTFIYDQVLHLRRLGTGGQMILISTPTEGLTEFSDLWFRGDPAAPDQQPRKMSLRMSTRENIGFGIDQEMFDSLVADMDPELIAQNIDGHFIQGSSAYFNAGAVDRAFRDDLPEMESAQDKCAYVQGVDPALRHDATWSIVGKVTSGAQGDTEITGVRAQRIRGKQTTEAIVSLAMDAHNAYDVRRSGLNSVCYTALDATGFGGKMFREALEREIPTVRSIEFGGSLQKKRKLLGDLRTMIDTGRIRFPRSGPWLQVRRQLLGYKLDDKSIEQDAVMALACLVAEARRTPGDASDYVEFNAFDVDAPASRGPALSWLPDRYEVR